MACHLRGEDHPSSRLTCEQVLLIYKLANEGHSQINLARRFKVSRRNIYGIKNGQFWKWLLVGDEE